MGNTQPKVPQTTEHVIRLNKVQGQDRLFSGRRSKPFFRVGYPYPKTFRDRFSQDEWTRFDNEFLDVWNSARASTTPGVCKVLAIFPGSYLLCIPLCWLCSITEKRDISMHAVVAKANKYIFRPRGMYMKERFIIVGSGKHQEETAWYEIALTPGEISRLEKEKSVEGQASGTCCSGPEDYVTEDTVEDDLDFQRRWPVRDFTANSASNAAQTNNLSMGGAKTTAAPSSATSSGVIGVPIPDGMKPGDKITVRSPDGKDVVKTIPPRSEWDYNGTKAFFKTNAI